MTIYYSESTKSFYDTDIDYQDLPYDKIEVTREDYERLLVLNHTGGHEIYVDNGVVTSRVYVPVASWELIRAKRNRLLTNSDFTQMPDYPGDKEAWATYRQVLRDIPQTFTDPNDVVWPTPPGA